MINIWKSNGFVLSIFMMIFVFDLYLLGGGRVIEIFTVTLRMILFPIAMLLAALVIIKSKKISFTTLFCLLAFIVVIIYSSFISSIYGNYSVGSISGYLFVLSVVFFFCFRDRAYYFFQNTIALSSVFMSTLYLLFLFLVFFGKINFLSIYDYIPESELFLRGLDGFVYKGFVYILIGALYFIIVDRYKPVLRFICFSLCLVAIAATLTRGFMLSLIIVILIYYIVELKSIVTKFFIVGSFLTFVFLILSFFPEIIFRDGSDSTRMNDINEFSKFIDSGGVSLLLGSGISSYLGDRPAVENAYMDIWFRFGLIGLILLFLSFIKISLDYYCIRKISGNDKFIDWLYYSVVLIFVQSNFNPYVNNYIGGSFLMFVIVYFDSKRGDMSFLPKGKLPVGIFK